MALDVGRIVFWSVIGSTPLAISFFATRFWGQGPLLAFWRMLRDYRWHMLLFLAILVEKDWVDRLNDPIRGVFGDYTWLIWQIEGTATLWIQRTFEAPWLTWFLSVHYLWGYVFLNYFTVILWAHRDDRELASLSALNYSIIYLLAVPFYIFFNVQVTSDYIPGMKALLYNYGPGFYGFWTAHDPLDNAFPSLHIAIPWGLILVTWWTMRRRGYTLRDWENRRYLWFMMVNTAIFAFSILYLGIHWITDIPGGLLVGFLGAILADEYHAGFQSATRSIERRLFGWVKPAWKRLAGRKGPADAG